MEIQLTDFENAAFTVFIALLTRAISFFDLNLYIPLSLVDENFKTAHKNDAARKDKFFFRNKVRSCRRKPGAAPVDTPIVSSASTSTTTADAALDTVWELGTPADLLFEPGPDADRAGAGAGAGKAEVEAEVEVETMCVPPAVASLSPAVSPAAAADVTSDAEAEAEAGAGVGAGASSTDSAVDSMTMEEVICGKCYGSDPDKCFPGLLPIVRAYLAIVACDDDTSAVVHRYLALVEARAKGTLLTDAQWLRQVIASHPGYKGDSVLGEDVMYGVARVADLLGKGLLRVEELTGGLECPKSARGVDAARSADMLAAEAAGVDAAPSVTPVARSSTSFATVRFGDERLAKVMEDTVGVDPCAACREHMSDDAMTRSQADARLDRNEGPILAGKISDYHQDHPQLHAIASMCEEDEDDTKDTDSGSPASPSKRGGSSTQLVKTLSAAAFEAGK
jgi:hypothetical protein